MELTLNPAWTARRFAQNERKDDHRSPYQRDRARILHSAAFRRLQAKRQIHAVGENDFYRTRLTHSLEVAQIGNGLRNSLAQSNKIQAIISESLQEQAVMDLLPCSALIESLCLAHDIGHAPFGHCGENALNFVMHKDGGFESNAQTFRILTLLEPYTQAYGMNLTRRTLLGVLKYPMLIPPPYQQFPDMETMQQVNYVNMDKWTAQKGVYPEDIEAFNWVLEILNEQDRIRFMQHQKKTQSENVYYKTQYKSLDCSIMELADDIAYAVHDLEDAIVLRMVSKNAWQREVVSKIKQTPSEWIRQEIDNLSSQLFADEHYQRKNAIGALVNYFVVHVEWHCYQNFAEPLLNYNAVLPDAVKEVLKALKDFVRKHVIQHIQTQRIEYKGQRILRELFLTLNVNAKRLLPHHTLERWQQTPKEKRNRVICDYIAGMSDNYALKLWQEL